MSEEEKKRKEKIFSKPTTVSRLPKIFTYLRVPVLYGMIESYVSYFFRDIYFSFFFCIRMQVRFFFAFVYTVLTVIKTVKRYFDRHFFFFQFSLTREDFIFDS